MQEHGVPERFLLICNEAARRIQSPFGHVHSRWRFPSRTSGIVVGGLAPP